MTNYSHLTIESALSTLSKIKQNSESGCPMNKKLSIDICNVFVQVDPWVQCGLCTVGEASEWILDLPQGKLTWDDAVDWLDMVLQ